MEWSVLLPPVLTTVSDLLEFDVDTTIKGILGETGGYGCSADADAFPNASETIGPGVEVWEGVEAAIKIAASARICGPQHRSEPIFGG